MYPQGLNIKVLFSQAKFEAHNQVLEKVGELLLVDLFNEYIKKEDPHTTKARGESFEEANSLILGFMDKTRIQYYFKRNVIMPPPYYDDLEENCIDLVNRMLMSKMLKKAVKVGDGVGIRAMKLALVPFFLARADKQNSKYALYLFREHVDHEGADSLTKERVDMYCTINVTGKPGSNRAHDTTMENLNLEGKQLLRTKHFDMDPLDLEKSVLASNTMNMMVSLDKEVNGIDGATGGGHASKKICDEAIEDISEEIDVVKPFSHDREKVVYSQRMRSLWAGGQEGGRLSDANLERFLNRNCEHYEEDRMRRPY